MSARGSWAYWRARGGPLLGVSAENARRMVCHRGHPLTPTNTLRCKSFGRNPYRRCRICREASEARRRARAAEQRQHVRAERPPKPRARCQSGRHDWIAENIYVWPKDPRVRSCRLCNIARGRARYAARRSVVLVHQAGRNRVKELAKQLRDLERSARAGRP